MKSNLHWYENIRIDIHDINGNLIDTTQFKNQVTNSALNFIAKSLMNSTQDNEIKYMAWGSSSTAAAATNVMLATEFGRKAVTSQTSSGTGYVETICYISPTDCAGTIAEIGWFMGSSATADANTGCLVSRVLYAHVKTALESITVTRTDTFST
jgi:hypothetical protein